MKVYISVDIEGVTGVTAWSETILGEKEHEMARMQMTREAVAACEAAVEMGANQIYIKDAHDSARNMDITQFPLEAEIIRGWTGEPTSMLAGLDDSFDAAIFIGYHSGSGQDGNPLAHTIRHESLMAMRINDRLASEFLLNAYVAGERGVPVVFISGDKMVCDQAKDLIPSIESVAVKRGIGGATININPYKSCELIKEGVKEGLMKVDRCKLKPIKDMEVEMHYRQHVMANRARYYPGVKRTGAFTVEYRAKDMEEVMQIRMFIM